MAFMQFVEKSSLGTRVNVDVGEISVGVDCGALIRTVGIKTLLASAVCVALIDNSIGAVFPRKAKYATVTDPITPIAAIIIVVMFCGDNRCLLILYCLCTQLCKGRANGLRYQRVGGRGGGLRCGKSSKPEKYSKVGQTPHTSGARFVRPHGWQKNVTEAKNVIGAEALNTAGKTSPPKDLPIL